MRWNEYFIRNEYEKNHNIVLKNLIENPQQIEIINMRKY